jgi:hypothetical protein
MNGDHSPLHALPPLDDAAEEAGTAGPRKSIPELFPVIPADLMYGDKDAPPMPTPPRALSCCLRTDASTAEV